MTRPQMIRADTIDLQDHDAPSAKDHSRQPTHPAALGEGPPAPHQAITMKNATLDGSDLPSRSPRASQDLSNKELQLLQEHLDSVDQDDDDDMHRNGEGGANGADEDMDEDDEDDGMDDDMMDKISSSPSIDDGGYSYPRTWPPRADSLSSPLPLPDRGYQFSQSDELSSSPLPSSPDHSPFSTLLQFANQSEDHHHHGGYGEDNGEVADGYSDEEENDGYTDAEDAVRHLAYWQEDSEDMEIQEADFEDLDLSDLLVAEDDPLLDNSFDGLNPEAADLNSPKDSDLSWLKDQKFDPIEDYNDDDSEDISFSDARFVDSGWGGECLREIEDIDFEFVYALHTFVATVEGQANATKGDTMVLLDDSNSYWWLVRVVKDGSIGYLPAEHIETPTERLARLNKHRNIDLSQTMLGDNPEKSRNPLKKAMRRRNAKTVAFADPTYFEPSDNDYSSEEEEGDEQAYNQQAGQNDHSEQQESAKSKPQKDEYVIEEGGRTSDESNPFQDPENEETRGRQNSTDLQEEENISGRIRNGVVRNTDSFFKDDTVETRKISITPSILRDESENTSPIKNQSQEPSKSRGSIDSSEKTSSLVEKPKDEKRKEKKSGMLSGLFKRKDKKSKSQSDEEDLEWLAKEIGNTRVSPQPKVSSESQSSEPSAPSTNRWHPVRPTSKQGKPSSSKAESDAQGRTSADGLAGKPRLVESPMSAALQNETAQKSLSGSKPIANAQRSDTEPKSNQAHQIQANGTNKSYDRVEEYVSETPDSRSRGVVSPARNSSRNPSKPEPRTEIIQKPKRRMKIEDDSEDEEEEPRGQQHSHTTEPANVAHNERLSESPVEVSPVVHPTNLPSLVADSSSHESGPLSPVSPSSTPELIERPTEDSVRDATTPASTVQSTRQVQEWSDANLRTYLENNDDIRDLLVVVHDTSDLKPVAPDHPVISSFKEDTEKLGSMQSRLDSLLKDFLDRRTRK